jgi:ubiquinone/menaquinone biosynthesis C-methylase UbiE
VNRLLVATVLRPFGEHLAAIVDAQPGDVCVDVGCAGGVMPSLLARTAHACIAAGGSPQALAEARDEMSMLHIDNVTLLRARGEALPLRDGCAQVVTSLFTMGDGAAAVETLGEMLRVLDPRGGRLACALSAEIVPGLTLGTGDDGQALASIERRIRVMTVRDVARFDSIQLFSAAKGCSDRGVLRRASAHIAPDGTLRLPVDVVTLVNTT